MNEEEKKQIYERYNWYNSYKKIWEITQQNKKEMVAKQ
jgi:hypothetical protein